MHYEYDIDESIMIPLENDKGESDTMAKLNVPNRTIFCHDNLGILENINTACIDLIYLDPPFNKNKNFVAPITSSAKGAQFSDIFRQEHVNDEWLLTIQQDEPGLFMYLNSTKLIGTNNYTYCYLCYMAIRLIECKRILKSNGSLYLHCDPTMSHYLKQVLDIIFGDDNFINEIIWHYQTGGGSKRWFARKHDIILFYSKSGKYVFNHDAVKMRRTEKSIERARNPTGARIKSDDTDKTAMDVWTDLQALNPMSKERTGYPTQKPLALLERIIQASSKKGDVVLDPFCGCATTCVAAENLGRKWIGIDVSNMARELVNKRLNDETQQGELIAGKIIEIKPAEVEPPMRTDEGAKDTKQKFVYVISHHNYQGEYKVGVASNVDRRLSSYQTSDPDRAYKKEFEQLTPYFNEIEKKIHNDFDNKHEWVKGDIKEIIKTIKTLHKKGNRGKII